METYAWNWMYLLWWTKEAVFVCIVVSSTQKDCYGIDISLDNMLGNEFCEKVNEYLVSTGEETHGIGVFQSNPDQSKHLETAWMRLFDVWIDFVNLRFNWKRVWMLIGSGNIDPLVGWFLDKYSRTSTFAVSAASWIYAGTVTPLTLSFISVLFLCLDWWGVGVEIVGSCCYLLLAYLLSCLVWLSALLLIVFLSWLLFLLLLCLCVPLTYHREWQGKPGNYVLLSSWVLDWMPLSCLSWFFCSFLWFFDVILVICLLSLA